MKKFSVIMTVAALLASNVASAQPTGQKPMGQGAQAATNTASDDWAWGIGLGGLVVLGVVVGVTAASAASTAPTFSH